MTISDRLIIALSGLPRLWGMVTRKFWERYALAYCRRHCAHIESRPTFLGRPVLYFEPGAEVRLGSGFVCRSGVAYSIDNLCCSKIVVNRGARLAIGNNSGISNVMIQCHKAISIGNNVNIGAGCMVFDTDFHSTLWQVRRNRDEDAQRCATAPVTIGDDVFIGARCIIGKGITIGNKAMVAAGSVVTKSIPQGELWGGAPARFIRKTSCL